MDASGHLHVFISTMDAGLKLTEDCGHFPLNPRFLLISIIDLFVGEKENLLEIIFMTFYLITDREFS